MGGIQGNNMPHTMGSPTPSVVTVVPIEPVLPIFWTLPNVGPMSINKRVSAVAAGGW